jgi:F0F1-type ATP synthase assembly protein I
MNKRPQSDNNDKFLYRYLSLGSQILGGLAIAVFAGWKLDHWLHTLPLFSCLLPLLILVLLFYRLIKDTRN